MKYEEFKEIILTSLREQMGNGFVISIKEVIKNNDQQKDALVIQNLRKEEQMIPLLYLERYYEVYQEKKDLKACIQYIQFDYLGCQRGEGEAKRLRRAVLEWEEIKESIYPVLVPKKGNEVFLSDLLSHELLDLAICYHIRLDYDGGQGDAKIRKEMFDIWNISEEELQKQAMENLKKDGYAMAGMDTLLHRLTNGEIGEETEGLGAEMYVFTNEVIQYGAAGMLLLKDYLPREFPSINVYIIPSSVHELLLVPDTGSWDAKGLNQMVREVNETQVSPEEWLSDHVYYYDWEKDEIFSKE